VGSVDDLAIFTCNGLRQPAREFPILCRGGWLGQPDRRLSAGLLNLLGKPLEALAVSAVEGKSDEPVQELHGPETTKAAPQRYSRGRGLPRQAIREEYPA